MIRHMASICAAFLLLLFLLQTNLGAKEETFTVESFPSSTNEFLKWRDSVAATPEGGAAVLWTALALLGQNKSLGLQCLTIALDQSNVKKGDVFRGYAPSNSIQYHLDRLARREIDVWTYFPYAYAEGGTAENNYRVNAPYFLKFSRNRFSGSEESGRVKVFIKVYGLSARPITMKRNQKGIWKAAELSSLFVDVPAPASTSSGQSDDL